MAQRKSHARLTTLSSDRIAQSILSIRGYKVMLDVDLAALYEVETKILNQAVKRNIERFPSDFMFPLSGDEINSLRSQIVTLKRGQHRKYAPRAFTEHGIAMLSSVLRGKLAVQVNIEIMRSFVKLRELLASNTKLARQLDALEGKYDKQFKIVFDAIRALMVSPKINKRPIGFKEWD
ncbi:MAG: ORF6N domain-containing protein [Proteobacteria bacterium]|nr:ORF6N domain-containing protein [Pseudomonadota bacterium]